MNPVKVITVEKSRELERAADEGGLSFAQMMENAGRGTARAIEQVLSPRERRVVVLVGPGNNGGDGLVAAHYLAQMGARVTCYLWKREAEGDANLERVQAGGVPVIWAEDDGDDEALRGLLAGADVVVDALLGVGASLPLRDSLRSLLEAVGSGLRERRGPAGLAHALPGARLRAVPLVVAVDCPTGLDSDTGEVDPATLRADVTVTFAYPKVGLLRFPGAGLVGRIVVADIGIPPELAAGVTLEMATAEAVGGWLPERPALSHKGTFGRVLVVAGSVNYVGAAALAGSGAQRVGAGLVTMALPGPIQAAVAANLAEATFLLLPHDMGVVSSGAVQVVRERMGEYDALLLGPGLSQEDETVAFVQAFLGLHRRERRGRLGFVDRTEAEGEERPAPPPLIVDADGLNALARTDGWSQALPPGTILTPHPGEMARLVGGDVTTAEIQADRDGTARRMAQEWGAVIVLKGALTVVAAPDGRVMIVPFANSGLATAGTGDVLAGAIAGLRAQGLDAFEAAVAGAYVHGLAGELARDELGEMGMVAGDLPLRLPLALRRVRS
ncbi:MAG TPA: NAD(P)H-hydrate dehydratase [Anaerolineae bacterium]|nr:NAD(P)H-hydrate dehydratase [Anaerolineae bacterium]